ncbi:MAG TPA: alpha/beta fold hydrolase [Desulfobacterales bacterium]|nr:alpha/beta fold hydrolase [Desulfobacterales bacterium]
MKVKSFNTRSEGYKIEGNIHFPVNHQSAPCVICSHGLFSSKESPKFIAMAEQLAGEGFVAIRYDHRGCGMSEGKIEETTVSNRLKDLDSILDFVGERFSITRRIGLFGSSMGGYISLLKAAQATLVSAVVVWATPFKLGRTRSDYNEEGYPLLKESFYEDLNNHKLLDVLGGIKRCFVIHGQKDELVPVRHSNKIYENLADPKKIEIFPGGDHRFTNVTDRKRAMALSVKFFKNYL